MTASRRNLTEILTLSAGLALLAQVACTPTVSPSTTPNPETTPDTGELANTEPCVGVTFTNLDGEQTDLTQAFTDGEFTTLSSDGTLTVCAGEWFVRLTTEAKIVIEGEGAALTTLSGGDSDTVLTVTSGTLTVSGVHIDRGRARGFGNASKGGAILCDGGRKVTLSDSLFTRNRAYDGGAVYLTDGCKLSATDVVFSDNTGDDDGGTLCAYNGSEITLNRVTIEGGSAREGGAVYVFAGSLDMQDVQMLGNSAVNVGGAIMNYRSALSIRDSDFRHNRAEGGGAILNEGDATLERVSFTSNTSETGGAVFAYATSTIQGTACSFSNNAPDDVWLGGSGFVFDEIVDFLCNSTGCEWDPA